MGREVERIWKELGEGKVYDQNIFMKSSVNKTIKIRDR